MKTKIIFTSIGAAILIVLAGFTSAIETQINEEKIESPLFKTRLKKTNDENKKYEMINYLGKGYQTLDFSLTTINRKTSEKIIDLIYEKPEFFDKAMNYIIFNKKIRDIFLNSGISLSQIENEINELKKNPDLCKSSLNKAVRVNPEIAKLINSIDFNSKETESGINCMVTALFFVLLMFPLAIALCIVFVMTMSIVLCFIVTIEPNFDCENIGKLFEIFIECTK